MRKLTLIGSEIGRGHPFYMDGLRQALRDLGRADLLRRCSDVFALSTGVSHLAWTAVRATYHFAGRGGRVSAGYARLRGGMDYDAPSAMLRVLGRDVRRWAGRSGLVVVDHPAVVGALSPRARVWYVHGEHAAPREAAVRTAARIFVPQQETAAALVGFGVERERIVVTGLCVEAPLARSAAQWYATRQRRLSGDGRLTVALFSSGAEPVSHVRALAAAAESLVAAGHQVIVFAQRDGRLERRARRAVGARLVGFTGRRELDDVTARHFAAVDVVAAPPHERCNWALGLGVPLFLVGPDVGTFAPINRRIVTEAGVARALSHPFASHLETARKNGELASMARHGWGRPIDGFARTARSVVEAADGAS